MFAARSEPAALRGLCTTDGPDPETYGADFLLLCPSGLVGVQRKEIHDLVSSLRDGRLARELAQMQALERAVLIVEGEWRWTSTGESLSVKGFTSSQFRGVMLSVQQEGVWTVHTATLSETAAALTQLDGWFQRAEHHSLFTRPKAQRNVWGTRDSEHWGWHWWQGHEGIGIGVAKEAYAMFGVPVRWTITREDLLRVKGIGRKRADVLMEAYGGSLPDMPT